MFYRAAPKYYFYILKVWFNKRGFENEEMIVAVNAIYAIA